MWKNIRAAAFVVVVGCGATGFAGGWGGVKIGTGGNVSIQAPGAEVEVDSRHSSGTGGSGGMGEAVVQDGQISLSGTGQTQTVTCDEDASEVFIEGTSNDYRIEGTCKSISVSGTANKVRVDTVGRVEVEGTGNVVLWRHGLAGAKTPKVSSSGVNNKISRAR